VQHESRNIASPAASGGAPASQRAPTATPEATEQESADATPSESSEDSCPEEEDADSDVQDSYGLGDDFIDTELEEEGGAGDALDVASLLHSAFVGVSSTAYGTKANKWSRQAREVEVDAADEAEAAELDDGGEVVTHVQAEAAETVLPLLEEVATRVRAAWCHSQGPYSLRAAVAFLTEHDGAETLWAARFKVTMDSRKTQCTWARIVNTVYTICAKKRAEGDERSWERLAAQELLRCDHCSSKVTSLQHDCWRVIWTPYHRCST
jgi:hypothetical protein